MKPKAATAWCQVALRRRNTPGSIAALMASQKLPPASQAHHATGSQVEMTSYHASSGASSWAALRA